MRSTTGRFPFNFTLGADEEYCRDPSTPIPGPCYGLGANRTVRYQLLLAHKAWWDRHVTIPSVVESYDYDGDSLRTDTVDALYLDDPGAARTLMAITDSLWVGDRVPLEPEGFGWHRCLSAGYGERRGRVSWELRSQPNRSLLTFEQINPTVSWRADAPLPWWNVDPYWLISNFRHWPGAEDNIYDVLYFALDCPVPIPDAVPSESQPLRGSDGRAIARLRN